MNDKIIRNQCLCLLLQQVVKQQKTVSHQNSGSKINIGAEFWGVFQRRVWNFGPVDKLKRNGLLHGMIIISIVEGHFDDEKTEWTNSEDNPGHRFYDSRCLFPETD